MFYGPIKPCSTCCLYGLLFMRPLTGLLVAPFELPLSPFWCCFPCQELSPQLPLLQGSSLLFSPISPHFPLCFPGEKGPWWQHAPCCSWWWESGSGMGGGTCRFGQNHKTGSLMGSPQLLWHSTQWVRAPAVGVYGNLSQPRYFFYVEKGFRETHAS